MGCCHSVLTRRKIKIEGEGIIDDEIIDAIILKTNFEEEEILNLLIEYIKLEPNENGLISNYQFLQMPNIKYSPFGYHLLEVFEMNGKQAEKDLEKGIYKFDNVRRRMSETKKEEDKKSDDDKKSDEKKKDDDDEDEEDKKKKKKNDDDEDEEDKKKKKKDDDDEDEEEEDKKKKKKDDDDEDEEDKKKKKKDDDDEDEEDKKKKKKDDDDEDEEDKKKKKKKDDDDEDDKKSKDKSKNKKDEVEIPLDNIPDSFKKYDLTAETKLLKKLYEENGDTIQYINFKKFCEILYFFSSHVKVDEKARIFFKLFDFDKDGRIGIKDIKTYLDNLNRPANEILIPIKQADPEDSKQEISINSDNDDEDSEEEKKNKKNKKNNKNSKEKDKKTNNDKNNNDSNNNENEVLELDQLQKEDKSTQIANLIIKEATNNNKEFLDFFDFRYIFLNTQFIPDYQHNLYLYEELPNEKELHILKSN